MDGFGENIFGINSSGDHNNTKWYTLNKNIAIVNQEEYNMGTQLGLDSQ